MGADRSALEAACGDDPGEGEVEWLEERRWWSATAFVVGIFETEIITPKNGRILKLRFDGGKVSLANYKPSMFLLTSCQKTLFTNH